MGVTTRREFLAAGTLAAAAGLTATRYVQAAGQIWVDRQAHGPFQCVSEFPLAPLEGVFAELARLEHELQRTLGLAPADKAVDVFLLADESSHRALLARLYPWAPYRRALYVQREGRAAVYAFRHPELPIDLRHECTHALLHASLPAPPLWLDEGLAEYFEMPEAERAFGHPHLAAVRWNLRLGMRRSVQSLENAVELNQMGGVEYRFSWAWVHFMLHGPVTAHRALVQFVGDLRRGEVGGRLSKRLRAATPDVDARMVRHFANWPRHRDAAG